MFRLISRSGQNPIRRGARIRAAVAAAGAAGLVTALAGPAIATPAPVSTVRPVHGSDAVSRELQAALDDVVAAGATGAVLRVDDGKHIYRLASGQARLDPPQRMYPGAKVRVASITKSFVSTVTL